MNLMFALKVFLIVVVGLWLLIILFERLFLVGKPYRGTSVAQMGDEFFMPGLVTNDKTRADLLRWTFGNDVTVSWDEPYTTDTLSLESLSSTTAVRATFINHATVLLESDAVTIITDPIFSMRASPLSFAGPRRHHDPYIPVSALSRLDYVLISHAHYDHLSLESIRMIEERFSPTYITPLNNGQFIMRAGVPKERIVELDLYGTFESTALRTTLDRAQHWNVRGFSDRNRYLWGSFIIEMGDKKIFFAGDTGYAAHFTDIKNTYLSFDLALLPIGAYEPRWFMKTQQMNPDDAIQAGKDLGEPPVMGIHFGTFKITNEGRHDPERHTLEALREHPYKNQFLVPTIKNGLQIGLPR
jgi:L-ascorbate metabolism protein UlaG (beta-lactamase superfamily)